MITNALSVDVEEYYHAQIFRAGVGSLDSVHLESRVARSVEQLLVMLYEHNATATFFVLGEIAERHPRILRQIAAEGHEIASHGGHHDDVYRFSPREFRADIRDAKARIEDVVGGSVVGYRAPNFSIGPAQGWAYEVLLEEGFDYDSSLYPIRHDRYGQADAPRFPFEIWRSGASALVEFPIGTVRVFGTNLPIGGGGFFRLLPFALTQLGIQRVNTQERRPVMFYLHPWELDPEQPRPEMPWHLSFRHYVGVAREAMKLDELLLRFHFGSARGVLEMLAQQPFAPIEPAWLQRRQAGVVQ